MKKNTQISILILLLFVCTSNVAAQNIYSVIAKNGLSVREAPELKANKLGQLELGDEIEVIERTTKHLQLKDNSQYISGFWYKVKKLKMRDDESRDFITDIEGYVFSGYLLEKVNSFKERIGCEEEFGDCDLKISTADFTATIFDYQIENYSDAQKKEKDIYLYEAVFNDLGDHLLFVAPKDSTARVSVFFSIKEQLGSDGEEKKWISPEIEIPSKNQYFFQLPIIEYEKVQLEREARNNLKRADNYDEDGEGAWFPKFVYNGKSCRYLIKSVFLKIVIELADGTKKQEIIEFELSYGC